jgi:alpha-methylacyl-CoA racemase
MVHGFLAAGVWRDERGSNLLDTGAPFYDVYETADGRHMAVGALEPQFYAEFVRLLEAGDDLPRQHDAARWPELRARIAQRFSTKTMAEWTAVFEGTDACVAPVVSLSEAHDHPHLAARGTFVSDNGVVQPRPRRGSRVRRPRSGSRPPHRVSTPGRPWPTGESTTSRT